MKLLDFITGKIGQILSLSVGLLGLLYAVISNHRNKKRKIIQTRINSTNIITENANQIPNIKILYKDTPVVTLTVSKVCVWNAGNDVIRKSDVSDTSPLAISVRKDFELFECRLLSVSDKDCNISLHQVNKKIVVEFAYLEPKQGFIIQIIHTGENSESLHISGIIINGKNLLSRSDHDFLQIKLWNEKVKLDRIYIKFFMILSGLFFLIIAMFYSADNTDRIISYIFGASFILIGFLISTSKEIPSKLQKTFEEG